MNWKLEKLGDVCDVRDGTHDSPKYIDTGYPLITSKNIKNGQLDLREVNYISEKDFNEINKRSKVDAGDILLPMIGTIGNPIIVKEAPTFAIKNVCLIKSSENAFNGYIYYVLISDFFTENLLSQSRGGTQKFISLGDIRKFKIPKPPIPTQQKIAAILDEADALRRKDKALLTKYDELLQAVFYDMFGDPVRNEKGWEVRKFDDVGKLDRGVSKHRPRNAPELLGGKYPLIQTGEVANSNGYVKGYRHTYSDIGLKQSKLWKSGTLCITIAANIAKTGILTFDACFPDSVVGFLPNESTNVEYIQWWLSHLQEMLEATAPESAQKNINLEILRNLDVPIPPIEVQNDFASIVQNIEQQKSQIFQQQTYSENLFQSLMQRAFKGELVG